MFQRLPENILEKFGTLYHTKLFWTKSCLPKWNLTTGFHWDESSKGLLSKAMISIHWAQEEKKQLIASLCGFYGCMCTAFHILLWHHSGLSLSFTRFCRGVGSSWQLLPRCMLFLSYAYMWVSFSASDLRNLCVRPIVWKTMVVVRQELFGITTRTIWHYSLDTAYMC